MLRLSLTFEPLQLENVFVRGPLDTRAFVRMAKCAKNALPPYIVAKMRELNLNMKPFQIDNSLTLNILKPLFSSVPIADDS